MEEREDINQLIKEGYTVCIAAGNELDEEGNPLTYRIFVLDKDGQKVTEAQSHYFVDAMTDVYASTPEVPPVTQLALDVEQKGQ